MDTSAMQIGPIKTYCFRFIFQGDTVGTEQAKNSQMCFGQSILFCGRLQLRLPSMIQFHGAMKT